MKALALVFLLLQSPKFDWTNKTDRGIVLEPGKVFSARLPDKEKTRIKVELTSDLPVTIGIRSNEKPVGTNETSAISCVNVKVWKVTFTCELRSDTSWIVMKTDTINSPRENKVHIVVSRWVCIENCR